MPTVEGSPSKTDAKPTTPGTTVHGVEEGRKEEPRQEKQETGKTVVNLWLPKD